MRRQLTAGLLIELPHEIVTALPCAASREPFRLICLAAHIGQSFAPVQRAQIDVLRLYAEEQWRPSPAQAGFVVRISRPVCVEQSDQTDIMSSRVHLSCHFKSNEAAK